jgi:hypothetical protein
MLPYAGLLSRDGSFCVADRALASAGNSSSTLPGHLGLSSSVGAALSDLGSRGAGSAASSKGAAGEGGGLVTVASAPGPSSGSTGSKHAPGTTSGKSRFAQVRLECPHLLRCLAAFHHLLMKIHYHDTSQFLVFVAADCAPLMDASLPALQLAHNG